MPQAHRALFVSIQPRALLKVTVGELKVAQLLLRSAGLGRQYIDRSEVSRTLFSESIESVDVSNC